MLSSHHRSFHIRLRMTLSDGKPTPTTVALSIRCQCPAGAPIGAGRHLSLRCRPPAVAPHRVHAVMLAAFRTRRAHNRSHTSRRPVVCQLSTHSARQVMCIWWANSTLVAQCYLDLPGRHYPVSAVRRPGRPNSRRRADTVRRPRRPPPTVAGGRQPAQPIGARASGNADRVSQSTSVTPNSTSPTSWT